MSHAILVEGGIPRGAIQVDAAADELHRFLAEEIQRYVELLTGGRLPIVTELAIAQAGGVILVGGPPANRAVTGLVELGGLTADGAYLLKSVELDGRGCVVVAGRDDAGTMYAAYELLERLGVVFQLTGDIVPERQADLELPELDVGGGARAEVPWRARVARLLLAHGHGGLPPSDRPARQVEDERPAVLLGDGGAVGRGLP